MTVKHVIKRTHDELQPQPAPIAWCGHSVQAKEWRFVDAHHVAMAVGKGRQPCKRCVQAIVDQLKEEL